MSILVFASLLSSTASAAATDCSSRLYTTTDARVTCLISELARTQATLTTTQATLATTQATLTATEATLSATQDDLALAQDELDLLSPLLDYLDVDTTTHSVIFTGANVYVQSGAGSTWGAVNGLGNLIVGYDENGGNAKTGSHNLVVGPYHGYSSFGGLLAGSNNRASAAYASLLGGWGNVATNGYTAILGGYTNVASGGYATVSGGASNTVSSTYGTAP